MKTTILLQTLRSGAGLAAGVFLAMIGCQTSLAYTNYTGCSSCHGDFRGATSTKGTVFPGGRNHDMHRASTSMATACELCHSGNDRTPVFIGFSDGTTNNPGLGCTGCHVGVGLRAHHSANGVTECYDCHDPEPAPPETVKPPYYGTADTRVNNPGNEVQVANTNENWSVGDFIGLDNDGNNLYDVADFAIGGRYRILSTAKEGNNVRVTWQTAGGRKDAIQASGVVNGVYSNISSTISNPVVGVVTTNYLDVGAATSRASRFYRVVNVP